jgi:2-polyprenyl-6-methoxyphenol hydroxylase-like FAD-dependent oxidoreductase
MIIGEMSRLSEYLALHMRISLRICSHGYELMFFERREFLQTLYDCLPDKSRVLTGKKVVQIKETYNSVEVLLSDGTREKGTS